MPSQPSEQVISERISYLKGVPLIAHILRRLEHELPKDLTYHSQDHTVDVLEEAVRFAMLENLSDHEVELLAIAAAYHDSGFLEKNGSNENIGARIAREAMLQDGRYSEEEIVTVERMILDTALMETSTGFKQVPSIKLSRYLLDADLANLGRDDFFEKGERSRREFSTDRETFLKKSYLLLNGHHWFTKIAEQLLQQKKLENLRVLQDSLPPDTTGVSMNFDRLGFLAKLPLLLNSSLDVQKIVDISLDQLTACLSCEAATIFLLDENEQTLTFWAMQGQSEKQLEGLKMPADKGLVGWVIGHQESIIVEDASTDPRFFSEIDKKVGFQTRNMICAPLTVRGDRRIGAVQVLNKKQGNFDSEDLEFIQQFSHQVALAIDNARLYEAVQERNRRLETLDKRKNEMMTVIAHEFRTPLNLIGTSAELLASGNLADTSAADRMCQVLSKGVRRLTKLIGEIRNLSLTSTQNLEVKSEEFSPADLFAQVKSAYEGVVKERNIELSLQIDEPAHTVYGDLNLITMALKNLVSNAVRFTPNNGKVTLAVKNLPGMVELSVSDTGIGISPSEHKLIFEKFYEVGSALQHSSGDYEFKSGGLGLGLATVKSILEAHGSTIQVESELGKGSTFSFALRTVE